jgi:homoserine O-acetyltransferase
VPDQLLTGAWRPGDPVGDRRFVDVGRLDLELGGSIDRVRVAYETWGRPQRDTAGFITNAVLVEHALTGDAHVAGPEGPGQPTRGWWDGLVGSDRGLDTDRWFVVATNVLGGCQGTTGPSSEGTDGRALGSRFGPITVRDQVEVEVRVADRLGIRRLASVLGGSMGGMRALEWAIAHPDRVATALVLAVGAVASSDQLGTQYAQQAAIRADPAWHGGNYYEADAGPVAGLGVARRIAQLTYRSAIELEQRFGARPQPGEDPLDGGRYAVQSYLDHHADKLARRFDAGSYVVLTAAMNTHDIGRGRGGWAAALAGCPVPMVVAGIDSDRLYPLPQQAAVAEAVPRCAGLDVVASPYGHDGFLVETGAVGRLVRRTLELGDGDLRT